MEITEATLDAMRQRGRNLQARGQNQTNSECKDKTENRNPKNPKQSPIEPTPMQTNVVIAKLECKNQRTPLPHPYGLSPTRWQVLSAILLLPTPGSGSLPRPRLRCNRSAVNVPPASCINLTARINPTCSSGQLVKASSG